jgi:hypothetical protein
MSDSSRVMSGRKHQGPLCRQECSGSSTWKQAEAREYHRRQLDGVSTASIRVKSLHEHLQPSGSNGLMLGDILGRRAGLTIVEVTLFRFLDRRADLGSIFLLVPGKKAGLVGEDMALSMGLGLGFPDCADAPEGVDSGPSLGVFRAASLGVS